MDCRIGVYVCNCGTNIAKVVDCEEVARAVRDMPGVAVVRSYKYNCSNPGQEMIVQDIRDLGLDRVVVAACSPRMHEPTFRRALATGGINPYFLEMANIREQCSWVHDDPRAATDKAIALTRAAVRRVALHEPLEKRHVDMNPATLVLGGGIAGLTAALELAMSDQPVILVEREGRLGGNLARTDLTAPFLDSAQDLLRDRIARIRGNPRVTVLLNHELKELQGFVGNFVARVGPAGAPADGCDSTWPVGSVVVCTGYQPFDAARIASYGYGRLPNVITSFDLEKQLREGRVLTDKGRRPQYAAIIHCVGSRSETWHPYCSRVCCMTALKYGHEIRAANPDCFVYDLYIDMHAFGKGMEDFYRRSAEMKTLFILNEKNSVPEILPAGPRQDCEMLIRAKDLLCGEEVEIPADLVVLMVGMEARPDAHQVAHLVNISQDRDGWFIESHPKLDPVATTTDGVYIAGTCSSPKDIPDSVAQARATVARILAKIARGRIEVDAVYAEVDEALCSGCRICNELCPYVAIEYDAEARRSHVISALCKACGTCVAACPAGAIKGRHFTDAQITAQIEGLLA
jgi:heterodisulfide reductase subunit A